MEYYLEFGGGLGDIFFQMFHNGRYALLNTLDEDNHAVVVTVTHNPYVFELFFNHPKFKYFRYLPYPYWDMDVNVECRKKYGLPMRIPQYEPCKEDMQIFPYEADNEYLALIDDNTIGISASAGMKERNIPVNLLIDIIDNIVDITDKKIVLFGRTFSRNDREEIKLSTNKYSDRVVSLIDKLTIPGTMSAVYKCDKLITCHSSLCMLNWLYNKPTFLLYPQSTYEHHIVNNDHWSFGIASGKTIHSTFDNYNQHSLNEFITKQF